MPAIKQQILFSGPASDCRLKSLLMNFVMLLFVLSSHGCRPVEIDPTKTATVYKLPPPGIHEVTQAPTLTRTPIIPTLPATATPTNSPTSTPEFRLTPTRGLPPTKTSAPAEECPASTQGNATITFSDDPLEYGGQILQYLRMNGDNANLLGELENLGATINESFIPNKSRIYEEEVTGGSGKEIVVTILQARDVENPFYEGPYFLSIFIIGCKDYQRILLFQVKEVVSIVTKYPDAGIVAIKDFNADGVREIVYAYSAFIDKHGQSYNEVKIIGWDDGSFREMILIEDMSAYSFQQRKYPLSEGSVAVQFEDVDGNGTIELLLPLENWGDEGCWDGPRRTSYYIFMWDGEYYRYIWTDPGLPEYRFQASFDGDYFAQLGLLDRAESKYLQTINDPALKEFVWKNFAENFGIRCDENYFPEQPNEQPFIFAYTRLRLLELYVFLGRMDGAEAHWNYLESHYQKSTPGYSFALLARVFWETYQAGADIEESCRAVAAKAEEAKEELFAWMTMYGYHTPIPSSQTICPFTLEN